MSTNTSCLLPSPQLAHPYRLPLWSLAWDRMRLLESATSDLECALLYAAMLDACSGGWAVEIGTWKCRTTLCLDIANRDRRERLRIATIDPLEPYMDQTVPAHMPDLERPLSLTRPPAQGEVLDIILQHDIDAMFIKRTSQDVALEWDKPISLLFVDGSHELDDVRADWELWSPWMLSGALVVFHDTHLAPIERYVGTLVAEGELHRPRRVGSALLAQLNPNMTTEWVDRLLYLEPEPG